MVAVQTTGMLGKTGLAVSRLGLGTAEIGFAYGIGARTLPDESEAIALLKRAVERGVTFFDTANYYGLAEERIGKSGILKDPNVVVCTKCAKFLEDGIPLTPQRMERTIFEQVESSLRTLGVEALPLLLLHGPSKAQIEEGILEDIVGKLKTQGKICFSGASTRGEDAPLALLERSWSDAIQVAFSIADQRMIPVFRRAMEKGVGAINRSVYLKGAFAGRAEHLPPAVTRLRDTVARAEKIASEAGITLPELALRFTLSEPAIAVSLIGTSDSAHLEAACVAIEKGPLPHDIVGALKLLAIDDPDEIDPARWRF